MEVREIAKVLASLEPGASQESKLMLAMRFEETIFSSATSLADYRKKLAKRLKKLQKMYVPTAAAAAGANKPGTAGKAASDAEQRIVELRRKYGEALLFIYQRATKAVAEMAKKSGKERAQHLAKHTDNAKSWANQLGLLDASSSSGGTSASYKLAALPKLDASELDRLENHLQTRVENIRSHVVKLTEPDMFLQERLEELEEQYMTPATSKLMSKCFLKRFSQLRWTEFANAPKALQQALDKALHIVPPPSRDPRSQKQAALSHLEAMRAASQAVLAYLATSDKTSAMMESSSNVNAAPLLSRHILLKCHTRAVQGANFLQEELPNDNASGKNKRKITTLEDAWTKVMETPTDDDAEDALPGAATTAGAPDDTVTAPVSKRLKPTIVKSRVLFTPSRACPSNLLPALKRKGAVLQQRGSASYLTLDFEDAFTMTIYLFPLVVTLKAKKDGSRKGENGNADDHNKVSVWGSEGTWETLGHVVKERLDYASAQATQILRGCFAACRGKADFEWEIAEATALLKFLKLARTTYIPDWQDVDI
jgi:hypothetical protein